MIQADPINWFEEIFLSTEIWGYIGPIGLVIIGAYFAKRDFFITFLWFLFEMIAASYYLDMVYVTPFYWWHFMILTFGGICTCAFSFLNTR